MNNKEKIDWGKKKTEKSFSSLWDYNKRPNICVIKDPGEEKEGRAGKLFEEIMGENSPNLARGINLQIQEATQISNRINPKQRNVYQEIA